jgi:myosin heavy subunit
MTVAATTSMKQQLYLNSPDQQTWPEVSGDGHDFKLITRKYSNEMIQQSQRQTSRSSINHDLNNLRGSMSSSTSSIQNNMERISELKEDIKQIERKQEDSLELKRQLKDMEIKKNNFEALYKKNDQLLRETETKLEKEINEKQRLEWASKNLNMELKSVKQKLQSLEDEKDILNQRCVKLKEERDNYDEKLRIHQANTLQSAATGVLREEDIEKIKLRHREEMKLLSAENDDLHQRTKQLQSDLQLHKESLDVTIRYKIDLEKALEEKTFLQHELDRLKHEKDFIEQEKIDYKTKYDNLQEEIRLLLSDRSKAEQKLNNELQEQIKQRQRSTDDIKKYKTQIEQLNIKLGDAEARLLVLQTQNEALIASKDREIKNEFETLTHRLNLIESEKLTAEQRYHNDNKEIANKQQHVLHEPLVILTSSNGHQHSSSSPCTKCDTLQRSYENEREHRLQTEKDNERLRDVVSRQKQQQELNKTLQQNQATEQIIAENSKQMRSDTERVKYELDRLRHDFDKLVLNYEPPNNLQQQAQLNSQIDTLRQFYEDEFHRKQLLMSKLTNGIKSPSTSNGYHRTASPIRHDHYDHSSNGSLNCSICSNSRLLKERLENAIDISLADQRIQTIKQIPILPRQTSPLLTTINSPMSSVDLLRKRYYI